MFKVQVLCFATTTFSLMARLSFGSHHFQAQNNRNALQLESAQRVLNHSCKSSYESAEASPLHDSETSFSHIARAQSPDSDQPTRRKSESGSEEAELADLKSQITLLTMSNSELLRKMSTLENENEFLKETLKGLRYELKAIQKLNLVNDLESTVLSTFAKILEGVQKLKSNNGQIIIGQKKGDQLLETLDDNRVSDEQLVENEKEQKNTTPEIIETKPDYLDLTFFKPISREKKSSKSRTLSGKSEKLESPPLETIRKPESDHENIRQHQLIPSDSLFGTENGVYMDEGSSLDVELHTKEVNINNLSSSTPRKKNKRMAILDIYGDEIPVSKKSMAGSQPMSSCATGSAVGSELVGDVQPRGSKRALANITNKKESTKTKRKPLSQTHGPVDKSIFEYVDENVLMEQTQDLVRTIRDRLK